MVENQLAARLASARRAAGRSLAAVAEDAGISQAYLSKLERGGVRSPSPHVLAALSRTLGLRYQSLLVLAGYEDPRDGQEPLDAGVDRGRIQKAVREILEAVGEDPDRDGLQETPERVAAMYEEIFAGLHETSDHHLSVTFSAHHDEMVMVKDIPLYSMCEHHLVPFLGKAHVAYIPNVDGRITGLSKLARLVDAYSRRPQVQERLTSQIADEIDLRLEPRGVLVVIEAEHLCMSMRGVQKPGTTTITSAVRGLFRDSVATRTEALDFIRR
jgi:GTP cyclohydrolase IA